MTIGAAAGAGAGGGGATAAIAGRKAGLLSKVGLGTFVDPANGGGKLNARTTEELVRLIEIDGEPLSETIIRERR